MTATFLHRLRRAIRKMRDALQPARKHHIAAARRARLTRRAHDCQIVHRRLMKESAR